MADQSYRMGKQMFQLRCQNCRVSEPLELDLDKMPTEQAKDFIERHLEKCEDEFRKKPPWTVV